MEKISRTRLILLFFACFAFTGFAVRTGDVLRRPAIEPFRENATGIIFPARIDNYEKVKARINPDLRIGTDISYENESGALADVYVYRPCDGPLTDAVFAEHAKETLSRIAAMAAHSKLIRNVTALHAEPFPLRDGVCSGIYRITLEKEDLISRVHILRHGDRIIKIRVSIPVETGTAELPPDPFGDEILKLAGAGSSRTPLKNPTTGE